MVVFFNRNIGLKMKVLISGASGLIGKNLQLYLNSHGYTVSRLVRNKKLMNDGDVFWDPQRMEVKSASIEGFEVVIHLAGENIASKLWTTKQKNKILNSRVHSTKLLSEALLIIKQPPSLFICASATGFYGNRGDTLLDEKSPPGEGFLAKVVQSWEKATEDLKKTGIRVINLRFGVVLSRHGGVLARLLPLFKLGLGGKIGNGQQFMPWISLEDILEIVHFVINKNNIQGAVNAVAPESCRNEQFTKTLAKVLSRPAFINMPQIVIRFVLGEMADELFLASTNVKPSVLIENAYPFIHSNIDSTLKSLLKKN